MTLTRSQVLPADHGLTAYKSNAARPAARSDVRQFVSDIAAADGHPLPVRMRRSDGKHVDTMDGSKAIVLLTPRYKQRSLHKEYTVLQTEASLYVCLSTFRNVLELNMPILRVSLRARGLCYTCFVFPDTVRTVSDTKLPEKAQEWRLHLEIADATREVYRKYLRAARASCSKFNFDTTAT